MPALSNHEVDSNWLVDESLAADIFEMRIRSKVMTSEPDSVGGAWLRLSCSQWLRDASLL